jgi:hypothetical protein
MPWIATIITRAPAPFLTQCLPLPHARAPLCLMRRLAADEAAAGQGNEKGRVGLEGAMMDLVSPAEFRKPYAFSITPAGSKRRYILVAESEADRWAWLEAFVARGCSQSTDVWRAGVKPAPLGPAALGPAPL